MQQKIIKMKRVKAEEQKKKKMSIASLNTVTKVFQDAVEMIDRQHSGNR